MTYDCAAARIVPTVEDNIIMMRRYNAGHVMVLTLDQRMDSLKRMVIKILNDRHVDQDYIESLRPNETEDLDDELKLCWAVLRDIEYIDRLR